MKYLFITLAVQDGECRHDHRILHTTNAQNIEFAAQRYVANFWGNDERQNKEDDFFWFFGEITCRLTSVIEISKFEFDLMSGIFSGRTDTNNYFKIVQAGYEAGLQREEVEINCGENGKIMIHQDEDKLGFIIDVYGQNDLADTMTVWEEDLYDPDEEETCTDGIFVGQESNDPRNFSDLEINEWKQKWGQSHSEITANLGYPRSHAESDELLMDDYFWVEKDKRWYNRCASMFTPREQAIADYLYALSTYQNLNE